MVRVIDSNIFKFNEISTKYMYFYYKDYNKNLIICYGNETNYSTDIIFNIIYNKYYFLCSGYAYYNVHFDISNMLYKLHNPYYYSKTYWNKGLI